MKTFLLALFIGFFPLFLQADAIDIELTVPALNVSPYHRPYVAIWLETADRQGIQTISTWYEQDDWLKDMRQWWRKLGKKNPDAYDAVTGPTRKPGNYQVRWDAMDNLGNPIPKGEYFLCLEAAREAGGRDFLRQKILLGTETIQTYSINGNVELGTINITIHP